jgi:hypothetical protein
VSTHRHRWWILAHSVHWCSQRHGQCECHGPTRNGAQGMCTPGVHVGRTQWVKHVTLRQPHLGCLSVTHVGHMSSSETGYKAGQTHSVGATLIADVAAISRLSLEPLLCGFEHSCLQDGMLHGFNRRAAYSLLLLLPARADRLLPAHHHATCVAFLVIANVWSLASAPLC